MGRGPSPILLAFVLLAAFGLVGCGRPASGGTVVTVLGSWTGDEESGFLAMLHGFEKRYGIQVDYTGTRDADAVLASDLKDGNPPDLAVLATPGELDQDAAAGALVPIDGALNLTTMATQYGPGWLKLMQATGPSGARHYYAIIVKAALKSVIWYDPRRFPARDLRLLRSPDLTWSQLTGLATSLRAAGTSPWCMGLEDSSSSGWPGTDWIEDIMLHQSGPQAYDRWVAGTLPWTSAPVVRAWQTFGQVARTPGLVHGGTESELVTNYGQAGQPMFASPAGCYLDHEGSFITAFYTQDTLGPAGSGLHPRPQRDFDFIPFPSLTSAGRGSEEVAGDLLGMFRATPAARKLIGYLTTPAAQEAWISRPGSGAISVNRLVPLSDYPDPVSRGLARNLTNAVNVRFDASDSMPQVMENAFNNAVLQYLDSPGQLNVILRGLDQVRKAAY
ncbi:MAG TPA: ABC transporter substrate-binding protein [Streptosporangiaceae bacterium]|nr:ABC transporter substrate-binding protein [Streptosporangiaceae bacterium]